MKLQINAVGLSQSPKIEKILVTVNIGILTFDPSIIDVQVGFMVTCLTEKMFWFLCEIGILFFIDP